MLRFKQFINEKIVTTGVGAKVQWTQSLSTLIFDVGGGDKLLELVKIPLSPPIWKRIWPDDVRATVFHVTDNKGFDNLVKMQGKKRSLSAFTEMRGNYFSQGVQTLGGVIAELDGNILMAAPQDIMSSPDKTGRRWTELRYLYGQWNERDLSGIEKDLETLFKKLITTYYPGKLPRTVGGPFMNKQWMTIGYHYGGHERTKEGKKVLKDIIADYMDGMEAVMKKNAKKFRDIFTSYIKNIRRTDQSWDEVIVNQIKIKKVHLVESRTWEYEPIMAFMKKVKALKIPHEMYKSNQSLEQYIMNMARKETGQTPDQEKADDEFEKRQAAVKRELGIK